MDSTGAPPFPESEEERLEALRRLDILDSDAEREFDDLVAVAAELCQVPIATVTLVDRVRQWFKASRGLELSETPREIAFCAWTILNREPLLVADARLDARFATNPLVTGPPWLRFYAGFPLLLADGHAVGTLAVMDTVPRTLDPPQLLALRALAHSASSQLELRQGFRRLRADQDVLLRAQAELEARVEDQSRDLERASRERSEAQRLYRSLWDTTTDAVLILDVHSIIQYANPGAERMFGHPLAQLQGSPLARIQPERLRGAHDRGLADYLQTGKRRLDWRATEAVGLHADGSEIPLEISFSEISLDERRLFVGFIRDITERKRSVAALREERERAESTLRSIADGVITTDASGAVLFLNPMAEELTGWACSEAVGHPCEEVLRLSDEGSGEPLALPLASVTGRQVDATPLPPHALLHARSGVRVSVEGTVALLTGADRENNGWVIALRDVSQARRMAAQIAFQATHDALTGLANRTEFDRRLRRALGAAANWRRPFSLLYMDLDQFKVVNDTCGHVAGDEMLKQLASVLRATLRSSDVLARLGGDEFGVLLEDCPSEHALRVAEKLRDAVAGFTFVWKDQLFSSGVSIGHVHCRDDLLQENEVLSRADEACYVAKDLGRNRIHTYEPGEEAQARRHGEMQWVMQINQAFDERRFTLFAQPIFEVAHARRPPTEFEVLLRMRDRDGGLVMPMAFLPAAERYGLMPRVDRWVVSELCECIGRSIGDGGALAARFSINLSGVTLGDAGFGAYVQAELERAGVPGSCLCFEITETAAIANLSSALRLINELQAIGCSFALDDFGSGLSSFAYLKHLPVDTLKIDGGFVRGITASAIDRAMVASINEIGHLMGLRTIAEFVEDDDILAALAQIGVDGAQGYGLGRPAPLAGWLAGLAERAGAR